MPADPVALPEFPWDLVAPYAARARQHSDGIVDLSVGTPVDDVPGLIRDALADASNFPGYPTVAGTAELRSAIRGYLERVHDVRVADDAILPTVGSKELVAALALELGIRGRVGFPELAYPTYEIGAIVAGAEAVVGTTGDLVWLNSPSNPTGATMTPAQMRDVVDRVRADGGIVASDECYLDLVFDDRAVRSVLHPSISGGDLTGLLAVHSLSKRSNLAGYRAAFVAGDPALIATLRLYRRHAGKMLPGPVQHAMAVALTDDEHAHAQKARYGARRSRLGSALRAAGFDVTDHRAGLYLWVRGEGDDLATLAQFAEKGILVGPGRFYGPAGAGHVRIAVTATDERIDAACRRLQG